MSEIGLTCLSMKPMLEIGQIRSHIAAEIRAEAARQSLPLSTLADNAGIPRSTLHHKANGHSGFSTDELVLVAQVLGKSAASFLPDFDQQAADDTEAVAS